MVRVRSIDASSSPSPPSMILARRRFRKLATAFVASVALLGVGSVASAAGKKDADATKLIGQAMDEDYLNVQLDAAETKLQKALKLCGSDNCSPEVLGKIHIALATVHGLGQGKMDVAKSDFAAALKADPNAKLIDGLSSPDFDAAFKAAKAAAGSSSGSGGSGQGGDDGTGGSKASGGAGGAAPKPQGDFTHTPIEAGLVNTPLPIFAEIPDEIGAAKVVVRYKPYGGTKWESLQLQKMKGGFGGMIPCEQVESTGDFRYYIIATDDQGLSLAGAGSLKDPFKVPIKTKIAGDAPSLPGEDPPKQCMAQGECPPGLLGCGGNTTRGDKVEGVSCDATPECQAGLVCTDGVCKPGDDGTSPPSTSKRKKNLVSLGVQFDVAAISDGAHVCDQGVPGSSAGEIAIRNNAHANYTCTYDATGKSFYGQPTTVTGTDGIVGGASFAHVRLLAGYDRILPLGFTLGARIGYSFLGPPVSPDPPPKGYVGAPGYFPLHLEFRAGWMFAKDSTPGATASSWGVEKGMIVPHVFVGGGAGMVTGSVPVTVCDAVAKNPGTNAKCPGQTSLDAYQLAGQGFVDFGGGATYMIVNNFGVQAEVKFMVMVPTTGFAFSPVIAPVVAF